MFADRVGAAAATLMPLVEAINAHVLAGERIHADDTTVPILAKGKTRTDRVWTYVRDDRPFSGHAPPAALFFYSPDHTGVHPETHLAGYVGLMQADAYASLNGSTHRRASRADHRRRLLGSCEAQVVRDCASEESAKRDRSGRENR
jgi:Transposase IS66 family